jgi:hypothetical protein
MVAPPGKACSKEFHAYHTSGRRAKSQVHWIVLHDEEAPSARSAARYFTSPSSGGSAHLCVDDAECYRTLEPLEIPWGAASAIGANTAGFHIEQAGYASWSAVVWRKHLNTLRRAAFKTAVWAKFFKIPLVFVDAGGLMLGRRGITTHNEVSKASRHLDPAHASRYSHSDPGPFWPRLLFMVLVRRYAKQLGYS